MSRGDVLDGGWSVVLQRADAGRQGQASRSRQPAPLPNLQATVGGKTEKDPTRPRLTQLVRIGHGLPCSDRFLALRGVYTPLFINLPKEIVMARKNASAASKGPKSESRWNPLSLIDRTGILPSFTFQWKKIGIKRREVAKPNPSMCALTEEFRLLLEKKIKAMDSLDKSRIQKLPSARACRIGDNPLKNAQEHIGNEYFYTTDFEDAYKNLDKRSLTVLLVFIFNYEYYRGLGYHLHDLARNFLAFSTVETDPMFDMWESFVQLVFGGPRGEGIAFGSNLSPHIFNLYCEVYLDDGLRYYLQKFEDRQQPEKNFIYTRYMDDLVFSRNLPIKSGVRRNIRRLVNSAGFPINHKKSKVLIRSKGTIFVTKIGLRTLDPLPQDTDEEQVGQSKSVLVFPQWKRRRIQHLIRSFGNTASIQEGKVATYWNDNPELITGVIAEFLHYISNVKEPTRSDLQTLAACEGFQKRAASYLRKLRYSRRKTMENRKLKQEIRT